MASARDPLRDMLQHSLPDVLEGLTSTSPPSSPKRNRDPREVAIQHARILQHRKDLEAEILENLIALSEYPLVRAPNSYSAANPAPSDSEDFKRLIRYFQPSDYDDLIVERNANDLCGYVLCARPKRRATPGGAWKFTSGGIVKRKEHEQWCSTLCARRALYVKVQLNETAAWERIGIPDIDIELYHEKEKDADGDTAAAGKKVRQDQEKSAKDAAALAAERGDTTTGPLMTVTLRPKEVTAPPKDMDPNDPGYEDDAHLKLEGYKPKTHVDPKVESKT